MHGMMVRTALFHGAEATSLLPIFGKSNGPTHRIMLQTLTWREVQFTMPRTSAKWTSPRHILLEDECYYYYCRCIVGYHSHALGPLKNRKGKKISPKTRDCTFQQNLTIKGKKKEIKIRMIRPRTESGCCTYLSSEGKSGDSEIIADECIPRGTRSS